uniref:Probable G-protein coupled receptor 176-like n=1 Tax=Saccoglossus kowalevskii TaxID=10224 RepID=A0ABM0MAM5_SACKO|nr:PREDICTED: probable G-protein coupled receptor 176-like [Saccoglossus kowalevskii]
MTEMKLLKMLFVMVSVFLVCWGPYVAVIFYLTFASTASISQYAVLTVSWVTRLNAVINPVIYGYLNKHFRQGFYDLLRSCPCKCAKTIHFRVDMSTVSPTDHRVVTLHLQRRDNAPPIPDNGDIFVVSKNGIENKNINGLKKISVAEVHREDVRTNVPCSSSPGIPPPAGNEEASSGTNQDSLELKSNWMKGYGTRKRLLPPLGSTPETLVETNKKKRKGKKKRMKRRKSLETPEAHDELRTLKGVGNVTASVGSL